MGEVVTMNGAPLKTAEDLAASLVKECADGNVKSFVVILETPEGFNRIWYTRQAHSDIVFKAAALNTVAQDMAYESVLDEN